jgi:hypothetical protein
MLRVIKHEQDADGFCVLIHDAAEKLSVWVDVWHRDGEVMSDWNKYIFYSNEDNIKDYQSDIDNFTECSNEAINYLEKLDLI